MIRSISLRKDKLFLIYEKGMSKKLPISWFSSDRSIHLSRINFFKKEMVVKKMTDFYNFEKDILFVRGKFVITNDF